MLIKIDSAASLSESDPFHQNIRYREEFEKAVEKLGSSSGT
jgi:hypothetical protein